MVDKITITIEISDWRDHAPEDEARRSRTLRRIMRAAEVAAQGVADCRDVSVGVTGRVQFALGGKTYDVAGWEI